MKTFNKGSVTVEACVVLPLFLFFMLGIAEIHMLLMAEAHIHQSLSEAADYTAQYCYLESRLSTEKMGNIEKLIRSGILLKQFRMVLGEDFYVEQVITGGRDGVILTVTADKKNPKIFIAKARYFVKIKLPVIGEFQIELFNQIKQKAFLGYSKEEQSECYVYVTPNQEVYHTRRNCSHLRLDVQKKSNMEKRNYKPCGFCGNETDSSRGIYVAKTGEVYHCNENCIGLKRTVKRVNIKEVGNLGLCQRCRR